MKPQLRPDIIHVLEAESDVKTVIHDVAYSGLQEEAFYVLDVGDIVRKHKEWKLQLPRVQPFYAVKCNDYHLILEILNSLGANFDCASKAEIDKVLGMGVHPDRIIFANPAKQMAHIRYAASVGVRMMTFDNETELYKVKEAFPSARLVLRVRCDAKKAQCPLGLKFGAFPKDAPRLMQLAKELGLDLIGVSFHVGSGCGEPDVFRRCVLTARTLFDLGAELGFQMNLLDLGGGYPGNKGSSISETASYINAALDVHFPESCGVDVIAEPGRYYVASAFTLVTRVYGRRIVATEDETNPSYFYYINDGVYGSFNCLLYDHATVTPQFLEPPPVDAPKFVSSIWGPTCDSMDQVAEKISLPLMEVGDWLVWEDMGAYTLAAAGCFNGFPVPEVVAVAQKHTALYLKDVFPMHESRFIEGGKQNRLTDLLTKTCGIQQATACLEALDLGIGMTASPSAASLTSLDSHSDLTSCSDADQCDAFPLDADAFLANMEAVV